MNKSKRAEKPLLEEPYYTVITLFQPWASLVVMGYKEFETRSFNTNHRGLLLIHASIKIPLYAKELCQTPLFSKYIPDINKMPTGCILGSVEVGRTITTDVADQLLSARHDRTRALEEWQFGDYSEGRYAWILEKPVQWARPMPAKGSLGLWRIGVSLVDRHLGGPASTHYQAELPFS